MSAWSTLRRSHHRLSTLHSYQYRTHSTLPPPPPPPPRTDTSSTNGSFAKLLPGIITSSAIGLSLYAFSDSSSPSLSYADGSVAVVADHCEVPKSQSRFLFGEAYRRKIFFNYEKRIRMRSPPEKVFEYFASHKRDNGEVFMTPEDLMRAVVPVFPPSESHLVRDGYLRGERKPGELRCSPSEFFMLFDTDNDGLISFKEYIFFVTLLSIPESSFSVAFNMFDINCNREIDREEFKKIMALMRAHNRQGAIHCDGIRAGHSIGGSVEDGGLVEYFFGKDGQMRLHHDKFVHFLRDLHDEMHRLEFAHYDYKGRGTISAKDFALSMVASADLKHLSKLHGKVDDLDKVPHMNTIRITLEEFKSFAELRKKLQPFSLALFSYGEVNGLLTKADFKRAASQVCDILLSDNVMEIIFHVFDANGDGSLSWDEFVRVLQKREKDIGSPTEAGIFKFLSCWSKCTDRSGISRILN